MEILKQTDKRLPAPIPRWGCAMMVLHAIPQMMAGKVLTPQQVIDLYNQGMANGSIGTNCFINDNNRVISDACDMLDVKNPPMVNSTQGRFVRLKHRTSLGSHFVIIDTVTGIYYDPDPSLTLIKRSEEIRRYN